MRRLRSLRNDCDAGYLRTEYDSINASVCDVCACYIQQPDLYHAAGDVQRCTEQPNDSASFVAL